ncbi:MAG: outer membrane protein transport protein [Planctomycetia bacterium]|nr:outer membrane protein transport protein [Planctomycetia bacterium]
MKNIVSCFVLSGLLFMSSVAWSQGVVFRGVGAVNESMAGASTACPIDAAGALYWNPATIAGLDNSEVSINFGLIMPNLSISSQLSNGSGGGTTDGEAGAVPAPAIAIVKKLDDSRWSWGLSLGVVGGAKTNFGGASVTENPILSSESIPLGVVNGKVQYGKVGYGNINSDIQLLQLAPSLVYQLTDKLSIGFGPTLSIAYLNCTPLYVVDGYSDPNDSVRGAGSRWAWGGGFQFGAYYDTMTGWRFGASYKSQTWLEDFRLRIMDAENKPQVLTLDLDYPAILSFGVSYAGLEKWLFAFDMRYFFFEEAKYAPLGWENVFSFSLGVQRIVTEKLSLRGGYCYNQNPIRETATRENIASPLMPGHALFTGFSYRLYENMLVHLTYGHVFKATSEGPYFGEANAALGGYVRSEVGANLLTTGVSMAF